jgi:two-component system LytT family sensor kinase
LAANRVKFPSVEEIMQQRRPSRWRTWALGFVIWTIIGLSFASRSYFTAYREGIPVRWEEIYTGFLVDFWIWGLVSPLIFWLARRFPIERGSLRSRIPFHIVACAVFILFANTLSMPAYWYFGFPNPKLYPTLRVMFNDLIFSPFMLHQGLLVYWGTLIAAHAVEYYRQLQAGQMRAAKLASQLAKAQLSALKMQIHPHFLFNTLNSIAALLHKDVEMADRMIARLSDFLRITLNSSEASAASLKQELEFLKIYLDIEKVRFQERLVVEINVQPETLDAQVPTLILQPLIENAVRHGIAPNAATGRIWIDASREGDRILITVKDNGPGLNGDRKQQSGRQGNGVGLANTRERLMRFYEGDFRFEIRDNTDAQGTVVQLNVPFFG